MLVQEKVPDTTIDACPHCSSPLTKDLHICDPEPHRPVLYGNDGWLGLFMLTTLIRFVVFIFHLVEALTTRAPLSSQIIAAAISSALAGLCLTAAYKLWRYSPSAPKWCKILLFATIAIGLLLVIPRPHSDVSQLLYGVIWLLYFYKSKRVQNTFPKVM